MGSPLRTHRRAATAAALAAGLAAAAISGTGTTAHAAFFAPVIAVGPGTSAPWDVVSLPGNEMAVSEEGANAVTVFNYIGTASRTYSLGCPSAVPTCNKKPHGMAVGPDGKLYVVEQAINNSYANNIAVINLGCSGGACVTEIPIPTPSAGPEGVAAGADGNIWFTESQVSRIGKIACTGTTCAASATDIPVPTGGSMPFLITAGKDATVPVWFTERTPGSPARLGYVKAGAAADFTIASSATQPFGITLGSHDGLIWFTEQFGHKVGHIDPACALTSSCSISSVTEFTLAVNTAPSGIISDASGNLWFAEQGAGVVGEVTTAGAVHGYQTNIAAAAPLNVAFNGLTGHGWVANNGNGTVQTFDTSQPSTSPNGMYMAQIYLDTLSRPMEQAGYNYWVPQVQAGGGAHDATLTSAFTFSLEYRYDAVNAVYIKYLGRPSDSAGLAYWSQKIADGYTYEQFRAFILSSDEFYSDSGGNNTAYVANVYQKVLNRAPGASESAYWVGQLNGGASRSAVTYAIITSDEGYGVYVTSVYQAFLHRNAGNGVVYWTAQLRGGLRDEGFVANILASAEYYAYATTH